MAAEEKKTKRNWFKIVMILLAVAVGVIFIWFVFFKGSSVSGGNKYASAESIKKAKSGQYGTWTDSGDNDWFGFLAKVIELFGEGGHTWAPLPNSDNQAYASAWLKGMNLSRKKSNLVEFKEDIQKYINSSFRKVDWDVTTGEFVDSTAQS